VPFQRWAALRETGHQFAFVVSQLLARNVIGRATDRG
jgi:hypothetical protein